jgi:8-oxo-dGTP pyrophosphatase MutT (NUDIX family)
MKDFDMGLLNSVDLYKSTLHSPKLIDWIIGLQNPFLRSNKLGHITASGLVINDNKALLIFHPYIKQWMQPGGHIDEDELPIEAAIREVYEETGFSCIPDPAFPDPIDIDVHEIPANPKKGEGAHLHIDLLYKLIPKSKSKPIENIEFDWFSNNQIKSERIRRALENLNP